MVHVYILLQGRNYSNFLRQRLPELLEEIPLFQRAIMFFQQDGAPPHKYRSVTNFLNERFPDRWIGQYGPIRWPPRYEKLLIYKDRREKNVKKCFNIFHINF